MENPPAAAKTYPTAMPDIPIKPKASMAPPATKLKMLCVDEIFFLYSMGIAQCRDDGNASLLGIETKNSKKVSMKSKVLLNILNIKSRQILIWFTAA